jgi:hypothetical protein
MKAEPLAQTGWRGKLNDRVMLAKISACSSVRSKSSIAQPLNILASASEGGCSSGVSWPGP